jgi:hypothetical protein
MENLVGVCASTCFGAAAPTAPKSIASTSNSESFLNNFINTPFLGIYFCTLFILSAHQEIGLIFTEIFAES